jgi:hypothetical protein
MATLVALLSTGKGSWGQVAGLIKKGEWERVVLLGPPFAKEFNIPGETFDFIEFDPNKTLVQLKKEILTKIKPKLDNLDFGAEAALSIASGNGKEHMALISALLSVPMGVRFTALTKDGVIML